MALNKKKVGSTKKKVPPKGRGAKGLAFMRHVITGSLILLVVGFATIASLYYLEHKTDQEITERAIARRGEVASRPIEQDARTGAALSGSAQPSGARDARISGLGSVQGTVKGAGQGTVQGSVQNLAALNAGVAKKEDLARESESGGIQISLPPMAKEEAKVALDNLIIEAARTATWRDYHCKLMYSYYGEEGFPPFGKLLGLGDGASQASVGRRCNDLTDKVKLMGGWPSDKQGQDNFIICEGFEWVSIGSFKIVITPRRQDLARGKLAYSGNTGKFRFTDISEKLARPVGGYAFPIVLKADEKCIVLSFYRGSRAHAIAGKIFKARHRGG